MKKLLFLLMIMCLPLVVSARDCWVKINMGYSGQAGWDMSTQKNIGDSNEATFTNVEIGDKSFQIVIWMTGYGGDDYRASNGAVTIGVPTEFTSNNGSSTISGASKGQKFNLKYNVSTNKLTVTTPSEEKTYTVYYNNGATNWSKVYGFWKYNGNDGNTWPGQELSLVDGKYVFTFKTDKTPDVVIFNNGSSGGNNQTEDLAFENGKTYGDAAPAPEVDYTQYSVYFNYPKGGSNTWTPINEKLSSEGTYTSSELEIFENRFNFLIKKGNDKEAVIKLGNNEKVAFNTVHELRKAESSDGDYYNECTNFNSKSKYILKVDYKNNTFKLEEVAAPEEDYSGQKVTLWYDNNGNWTSKELTSDKSGNVSFTEIAVGNRNFNIQVDNNGSKAYYANSTGDNAGTVKVGETTLWGKGYTAMASYNDMKIQSSAANDVFTIAFNVDSKVLTVTKTSGTTVDYSKNKVTLYYEGDNSSWNHTDLTPDANGNVTFSNIAIGAKRFNIRVQEGSDVNFYANTTTASAGTVEVGENDLHLKGTEDSKEYNNMYVSGGVAGAKYNLTYNVETKKLTVSIAESPKGTVYLIAPSSWNDPSIWCFNNTTNKSMEGSFGSTHMTDASADVDGIKGLVLATGEKLWKYTDFDFATFNQVIFVQGNYTKQTCNLWAVRNGVYRVSDGLIPMNIVKNNELAVYTEQHNIEKYNTIYLSFDNPPQKNPTADDANEFFNFSTTTTPQPVYDNNGSQNRIGVEINYKGKKVTGNDGTTFMHVVTFHGKKFYRLDFPNSLVEDGDVVESIKFYEYTYKDNGGEFVSGKDSGDDETKMGQPGMSIKYNNVKFFDGEVFCRPPLAEEFQDFPHISDLIDPDRVYIVAAGNGLSYRDATGAKKTLAAGEKVQMGKEVSSDQRTSFAIDNVTPESEFNFLVEYDLENGGVESHVYAHNDANRVLHHALFEDIFDKGETSDNKYSIYRESPYNETEYFDVTIRWNDQVVYVTAVKNKINFAYNPAGDDDGFNSHRRIYAQANDVEGKVTTGRIVSIKHKAAFGGESGDLVDHYNAIKVTMTPRAEYAAFIEHESNEPAHIISFKGSQDDATVSTVELCAHTAGIYDLKLQQVNDIDVFENSGVTIPVRVMPTLQSIGARFNLSSVETVGTDENVLKCDIYLGQEFETTDSKGTTITWNKNRVMIDAWQADPSQIEVYWKDETPSENNIKYSNSVVRRAETAVDPDADVTVETNTIPTGYTKYSNTNTLDLDKNKTVSFVVKQNGIVGSPQLVSFNGSDTPTGVDEIGAAEEVEAVYYNLNGVRVNAENLQPGIYIVVKGNETSKILVR